MNNCSGDCNICNTECVHKCPECKGTASKVEIETVKSMLKDKSLTITGDTYVCLNRKCEVIYFDDKLAYIKEDVRKPIWFKEDISNMMVCYCYEITLQEIIKVVKETGITDKQEIIKYLGKEKNKKDCIHENPIGKDCEQLFLNAIEYAKGE